MARAIANCKCEKCGETFEKIAFKYNRTEADKWQAWAEKNCTICPDCWRKLQQEEDAAKAAEIIKELHLPEITGKSEKQVKYANDLRNKLLAKPSAAERLRYISRCLSDEQFEGRKQCEEMAAKEGLPVEEWIEKATSRIPVDGKAIWAVLHADEARDIIDFLSN